MPREDTRQLPDRLVIVGLKPEAALAARQCVLQQTVQCRRPTYSRQQRRPGREFVGGGHGRNADEVEDVSVEDEETATGPGHHACCSPAVDPCQGTVERSIAEEVFGTVPSSRDLIDT